MQTSEQKLRDVLGIYYDSAENTMQEVPKKIELTIDGDYVASTTEMYYNLVVSKKDDQRHALAIKSSFDHNGSPFLRMLLNWWPNFYIESSPVFSAQQHDKFSIEINPVSPNSNGRSIILESTRINVNEMLVQLANAYTHIPVRFKANVTITRHQSDAFRAAHAAYLRAKELGVSNSYTTPMSTVTSEKYFRILLDANREPQSYSSARGNRNFTGKLRYELGRKEKRVVVFLIEYLWGKKLSQSTKSMDLMDKLAGLPYNDFGIKDVVKLRELYGVVKAYEYKIEKYAENLKAIGILPKTDLKRWRKYLEPAKVNITLNPGVNGQ